MLLCSGESGDEDVDSLLCVVWRMVDATWHYVVDKGTGVI